MSVDDIDGLLGIDGLEEIEDVDDAELADADAEMDAGGGFELDGVEEDGTLSDPRDGVLIDTVDLNNDGYADVLLRDTTGDGQVDYVEGDLNNDGFIDIEMRDTTGDGVADETYGQENWGLLADTDRYDLSSINRDGPGLDSDGDGVSNWDEVEAGTDPLSRDTDLDNVDDKTELEQGSDPTDWASDRPADDVAHEASEEIENQTQMESAEVDGWETDETVAGDGLDDAGYDAGLDDYDTSYDAGYDSGSDY